VRPDALHQALIQAREREKTDDFAEQYAQRADLKGSSPKTIVPLISVTRVTLVWPKHTYSMC
jgi:hypothetical protein